MNHLGVTLVTAAVQVTFAMIPAVIVVAVTGRRNPRTAATLSIVSLALCLGLTATAFAPSPWRDWPGTEGTRSTPVAGAAGQQLDATESGPVGLGVPLRLLMELLSVSGRVGQEPQAWSVWAWLAIVALAGTGMAALRLAARLWVVAACRARSRPIRDAAVRRLLEDLRRELDCRRDVELRSTGALGTAATIGWRRPAILLADDWAVWGPDELRAVLAHELAHVCRRDYPAALLAGLCRAVHFYHPFVAWLAGRLRLHQELAADAIAAGAVGGRAAYLVALARMALRQERFHVAGAARPFLSDRNSLLRRIAMLRVTDDRRPLSRGARWGLAAVLIGTALAASAVRGSAQAPPAQIEATSTQLPPIDLCYVPEKSDGVFVLRPAALLARPEIKPLLENWNRAVAEALRAAGITLPIDLAEVELVVGPFELKTLTDEEVKKYGRPERHSVIMGLAMVRMTRDYDWPEFLKALAPMVETKAVKPGSFECVCPAFGPHPFTVHTPDARTLVLAVPGQPVVRTDSTAERWGAASKQVERAGYAVLLDNRTGRWTRSMAEQQDIAPAVAVLGTPAHLAFGLNWGECASATCAADWTTEPAAADVARGEATIRGLIEAALKAEPIRDATDRLMHDLVTQSLKSARVRHNGKLVTVETHSAVRWHDLLKMIPVDGKSHAEVKTIEK